MKRRVKFYVMTMKWDNAYSCYYGQALFQSDSYEECEKYCLHYDGPEQNIYIDKVFTKLGDL